MFTFKSVWMFRLDLLKEYKLREKVLESRVAPRETAPTEIIHIIL